MNYRTSTVVLALFAAVMLSACGGSYNAEKAYWHVQKKHQAVLADPAKASDAEFSLTLADLRKVISGYPRWRTSAQLQYSLGQMYIVRNDLDRAQEEFTKVFMNFPASYELCARAMFAVGAILERQGDWTAALKQYDRVKANYPQTSAGLQVPLYIAEHYQRALKVDEMRRAYASAVNNYLNLIELNPYDKAVPVYQNLLLLSYGKQGRWKDGALALEKFAAKYPKSDAAPVALYRAAAVYREVFKEDFKATELCRKIVSEYPKSLTGKTAQFDLGRLSLAQGDVQQAKEEFGRVMENYPDDSSLCAMAQLAIAAGYEKAGRWDDALREYRKLQTNFSSAVESLQAPLLIASHYLKAGERAAAEKTVGEGIESYRALIVKRPGKKMEAAAQEFTASAYALIERWQDSIAALQTLRKKYPNDPRSETALLHMGMMYRQYLNNEEKAVQLFTQFIQEYPHHRFVPMAQKLLNQGKK